jgi:tRNA pseudouridine13 synthase
VRALPLLTAELPGAGGVARTTPEDFRVEELPAYPAAGHGEHVLAWVEKRGLTTPAASTALARALGVSADDVGWAGLKDRHAVTRQWLSLPPPVTPDAVLATQLDGVTVLAAARHPHKLRTGHLRGNRFTLVLRGTVADGAARAEAILARLAAPPGAPAWFGEQRFGVHGDNAARGRAILAGDRAAARVPPRVRRLLISAAQSELFNAWLAARLEDGLYGAVIDGDVLVRRAGSAPFVTEAPAVEQARQAAGEVVVTGPMFGPAMRRPRPGSEAEAREAAVLAAAGLTVEAFAAAGRLAEGTRRPCGVPVDDATVEAGGDGVLTLRFTLPAGAYATAVLREVTRTEPASQSDEAG